MEFAELKELLSDAELCARLSDFEEQFLDSFRERVLIYGDRTNISDKQAVVLKRIQAKVYS